MATIDEIYEMFIENIKDLKKGDIFEKKTGVLGGIDGKGLKFMSKTRKGKHGRQIFLYLVKCPNYVKIELNSGKDSTFTIDDPKSLIVRQNFFKGIYGIIYIRPGEFGVKYSKKDVDDIMIQCYEMLKLRK